MKQRQCITPRIRATDNGSDARQSHHVTQDRAKSLRNPRHERFARLVASDGSGTRAYREVFEVRSDDVAGAAAARLLADVRVRARVDYLSERIAEKAITAAAVTKERVLAELASIAFANILDYIHVGADGLPRPDLSEMTRPQAAAVSEITLDTISGPRKRANRASAEQVQRVRLRMHSKIAALEQLGRHLKLFVDKVEVEDRASPKRHSAAARLVMEMLDMKAHGRLPDNLRPILDEITGRGPKEAEAKANELQR